MKNQFSIRLALGVVVTALLTGCGDDSVDFTLLADSDSFQQSSSNVNTKIDILWVIDNSGSMETSQDNLAANFQSFIEGFQSRNFDYKMAVTTTDAYRVLFTTNTTLSHFRDGTPETTYSGYPVIIPGIPSLEQVFITNIKQGILGYGDERAFQSFRTALDDPHNSGFVRPDSHLAIVIVSDEEDFSHDGSSLIENRSSTRLHSVQSYKDYLDQLTSSTEESRRYSVSAIAIFDQACHTQLTDDWPGRKQGVRYGQLVDMTGGVKGSLCDNFSSTLNMISQNIVELASQFYLSRRPIPESIVVKVNGTLVPHLYDPATGVRNPAGGWEYLADTNSIKFVGSVVPAQGSNIQIDYDPVAYGQ